MIKLNDEQVEFVGGAEMTLVESATIGGVGGFGAGISLGATVGSVGGPAGIIIGGLIGGLLGTVSGTYSAITLSM